MTWPAPTREDHETFCRAEGWQVVRNARGSTGTHHVTYELHLHDCRVLRSRISHPVDRTSYGQQLCSHILRDQLAVDQATFWACVRGGVRPGRGEPQPPADALPADLVHLLLTRVRLGESGVAAMTRDQAIARIQHYWATGS